MKNQAARWALTTTLALRIGISVTLAAAWAAIRPFIASSLDQLGINPLFPVTFDRWGEAFLGIWNRYDGYRYFLLAYSGYFEPSNIANTVFYPLYPMTIRFIWKLTGLDIIVTSLILSTIAAFFAFYLLFKTTEDLYGRTPAKYAVICLAIYPTALFIVGPYTESLFLALTLAAFYLARKDRWLLAGLMGALAALTRSMGVFTAVALAWVAYQKWRETAFAWSPRVIKMALGVAAPGLAGIGFMLWRKAMGFPPVLELQEQYFGSYVIDPVRGIINGLTAVFTQPSPTTIIEGLTVIFWITLFILMIRDRKRLPIEWLIYTGINLLVFTSKANSLISPMQSIGRYVLILFPGFIYLGNWLAGTQARKRFIYILVSSSLLIAVCGLYVIGFFVG